MADARLSIEINDKSPFGSSDLPGSGGYAPGADALRRSIDDLGKKFEAMRLLRPVGGGSAGRGSSSASSPSASAPLPSPAGRAWAELDFDSKRRAALNGRPKEVTDAEWATYGRENARRGASAARVSGRASAEAQRRREEQEEEARKEAARAQKEADAAQKEAERKQAEEEKARRQQAMEDARTFARARERRAQAAAREAADRAERAAKERASGHARSEAGTVAGAGIGRYLGAAAGTAIAPGPGTAIGAVAGGLLGGFVGGRAVGQRDDDKDAREGNGGIGGQVRAAADGTTKAMHFAGDMIQRYAEGMQRVAAGDAVGFLANRAEAAGKLLEHIPVAGKPLAAGMEVAGKALQALKGTVDAFSARGRELSGYNGSLAASVARQDVTRTLTDIREGQMLGDKYAKLIDAQTRFEETLKAGLLPLKDFVLDKLTKWLDWVLDFLIKAAEAINKLPIIEGLLTEGVKSAKEMRDALRDPSGLAGDDIVKRWLGDGELGFRFPIGERPAFPAPGLDIPAVRELIPR